MAGQITLLRLFYESCGLGQTQKKVKQCLTFCRGDRIRTCGRLVPNQERYRAALHPECFIGSVFLNCGAKVSLFSVMAKCFACFFSVMVLLSVFPVTMIVIIRSSVHYTYTSSCILHLINHYKTKKNIKLCHVIMVFY